jgi:hypothetical protein
LLGPLIVLPDLEPGIQSPASGGIRKSTRKTLAKNDPVFWEQITKKYGRVETLGVRGLKDFGQPLTLAYVSLYVKKSDREGDRGRRQAEDVLESEPLLTVRAPAADSYQRVQGSSPCAPPTKSKRYINLF